MRKDWREDTNKINGTKLRTAKFCFYPSTS